MTILMNLLLTDEMQCKETDISKLVFHNTGEDHAYIPTMTSTAIQVDGAGGISLPKNGNKGKEHNVETDDKTLHMEKSEINLQTNLEPDSLASDTSFSVSQFADISSDVDKIDATDKSKVGQSDTLLQTKTQVALDKDNSNVIAKVDNLKNIESVPANNSISIGHSGDNVSVKVDTNKNIQSVKSSTPTNSKSVTETVIRKVTNDIGSPHKSKSSVKSDTSTYGGAGDITDSSISEIYDNEYVQMKQKCVIWHKCKQAKLEKAAEEAKICACKQATEELEKSLGFKLSEAKKAELMDIQEIDDMEPTKTPSKKVKTELETEPKASSESKVDFKKEVNSADEKTLDPLMHLLQSNIVSGLLENTDF